MDTQARRMIWSAILFIAPAAAENAVYAASHRLLPVPAKTTWGSGRLRVDASLGVTLDEQGDERLRSAIRRFRKQLTYRTGIDFPDTTDAATTHRLVQIECAGSADRVQDLRIDSSLDHLQ